MSSPSPSQSSPNADHGGSPRLRRICLCLFALLVAALSFGCSSEPTGYDGPGDDAGSGEDVSSPPSDVNGDGDADVNGESDAADASDADPDVDGDPDADGDPEPEIDEFTVDGQTTETTILRGDSVEVAWASSHADDCDAGGDFPGWEGVKTSSGTTQLSTEVTWAPEQFELTLTCSGPGGQSATEIRFIEVEDHCVDRAPPEGWVHYDQCIYNQDVDCSEFANVWSPWPGTSNTRNFYISTANDGRQYVAMEFNSGDLAADETGRFSLNVPQFGFDIDAGPVMMSFSSCPGDYHVDAIEDEMGPGCVQHNDMSLMGNFTWGGSDHVDTTHRCGLEPQKTYYLNFLYADPDTSLDTDPDDFEPWPPCTENGACGHNITP